MKIKKKINQQALDKRRVAKRKKNCRLARITIKKTLLGKKKKKSVSGIGGDGIKREPKVARDTHNDRYTPTMKSEVYLQTSSFGRRTKHKGQSEQNNKKKRSCTSLNPVKNLQSYLILYVYIFFSSFCNGSLEGVKIYIYFFFSHA